MRRDDRRAPISPLDTASDDASDRFSFGGVDGPQDLTERIMRARDDEKSGRSEDGLG